MLSFSEMSDIINIAIATAKVRKLTTPYREIRPFMHLILCGKIGSFKSSILMEICKSLKVQNNFNLTSATLLGTIDKNTGVANLPAIWNSRNSILAIDEFHVSKSSTNRNYLSTLLSILEYPEFIKNIGYRCNDVNKKDGDLYCVIKNGMIMVKSRFVLVANTMHNLLRKQRMIELEALRTRCMILPYYPSLEDIQSIIKGKTIYKYKEYKVKKNTNISKAQVNAIMKILGEYTIDETEYARTFGDICRVISVVGFKNKIIHQILSLKYKNNKRGVV